MGDIPLDPNRIPRHVAIIMDGNGRWAEERGLPRTAGHAAGEESIFDSVEGALEMGIEWLTVFAFSTENWRRPPEEVEFLMYFNQDLLRRRRDEVHVKGVRIRFIGVTADPRVPVSVQEMMAESAAMTADNTRLNLVFAFDYGSRVELASAARRLAEEAVAGLVDPTSIDEEALAAHLYDIEMPDPELVIRTSGEQRLSNFMLWQAAYSELVFTPVLWPDFRRVHLAGCVAEFQHRSRRFGGAG